MFTERRVSEWAVLAILLGAPHVSWSAGGEDSLVSEEPNHSNESLVYSDSEIAEWCQSAGGNLVSIHAAQVVTNHVECVCKGTTEVIHPKFSNILERCALALARVAQDASMGHALTPANGNCAGDRSEDEKYLIPRSGVFIPNAHDSMSIIQKYPDIHSVQDYAEAVSKELHKTSDALTEEIRKVNAAKGFVVVDVLGVGAGPQSAIAFGAMKQQNPLLSTLIFEATNRAGTFDKLGKSFRVNNPEIPQLVSPNRFPGVPIQPSELNQASDAPETFMTAEKLGAATLLAHHYSNAGVVFNQRVMNLVEVPVEEAWPARYRAVTQDGLVIYTNQVVTATGYGAPDIKMVDASTKALIKAYEMKALEAIDRGDFKYTPGVETVDGFSRRATEEARISGGKETVLDTMPLRVMVVGPKDGGKIAVEALTGISPGVEKIGHVGRRFEILWAGQRAEDFEEYTKSLGHPWLVERYGEIGKHLQDDVKSNPKKVVSVKEMQRPGLAPEYEVTLAEPVMGTDWATSKTVISGFKNREKLMVDHVIFATGYDLAHADITRRLPHSGALKRENVAADISDYTGLKSSKDRLNVASRLVDGSNPLPIWSVGLISIGHPDGDLAYTEGLTLNHGIYGPRSAAAGKRIANEVSTSVSGASFQPVALAGASRLSIISQKGTLLFKKSGSARPIPPKEVFIVESKIRLSRIFDQFRFPKNRSFVLKVSRLNKAPEKLSNTLDAGMQLNVEVKGLDAASTAALVKKIQSEESFVQFLGDYFSRVSNDVNLNINFESRSDGTIKTEKSIYRFY